MRLRLYEYSYVVMGGIGLSLLKKGNTCRFIGRYKRKNYTLGSTNKGMKCKDAIAKQITYKNESDLYLQKKKSKKETTIKEVFDIYFDYYQATSKEKSWLDRKNKLDKMVSFLGADCPVTGFILVMEEGKIN